MTGAHREGSCRGLRNGPVDRPPSAGREMADDDLLERRRSAERSRSGWTEDGYPDERERLTGRRRKRADERIGAHELSRLGGGPIDDPVMGEGLGDRQVEQRVALAEDDQ